MRWVRFKGLCWLGSSWRGKEGVPCAFKKVAQFSFFVVHLDQNL